MFTLFKTKIILTCKTLILSNLIKTYSRLLTINAKKVAKNNFILLFIIAKVFLAIITNNSYITNIKNIKTYIFNKKTFIIVNKTNRCA